MALRWADHPLKHIRSLFTLVVQTSFRIPNSQAILAKVLEVQAPIHQEPGVKKLRLSSEKSASLAGWVVSGLGETRAKSAREAFKPKLKKNADLLINPNLDYVFYIPLKAVKSSSAAKTNIDPIEKIYRNQTFKILDLVKPIMFLASRLKKKKKSRADAKAVKTVLKLRAVVYHHITNAQHSVSNLPTEYWAARRQGCPANGWGRPLRSKVHPGPGRASENSERSRKRGSPSRVLI
ncbi:hypothetical protein DAPPUDRAFT_329646 [Daphnia pulex]|uniref:Uncharacterized protein n=1 Tax=Daphnia pulex TaxID=6669 RepID=E9HH87_DAPPU|nr:hypothetical protein DAPPUDRAFT_329646 [Daphnia pulex]|eukprot:EFX68900.1 hypothetical protein DAPPUDRAFT_329646 [Daphnia pulex]